MALGDRSAQYSQLLAQMLANTQNKAQAYPGHKIMATGGAPVVQNQDFTEGGVNLGGILKLLGKHPDQMSAQRDQLNKDAQMTQLWVGTNMNEKQLDQYYSQPPVQELLEKFEKAGAHNIWVNPDTNRKEFLPISPEMKYKLTGGKPLTEPDILSLPDSSPTKQQYIKGKTDIRPKTEAELAGATRIGAKYDTAANLNTARTGEAGASANLKGAQAGAIPSEITLRGAKTEEAKATADFLKGGKGQPAVTEQKEKDRIQKTVNTTMTNFHNQFKEATKVDYRYGTEEYAQQLTNLNSATVGTLNQLKSMGAKPEMAGVVGSWITRINKELTAPPKMSGGKLSTSEMSRLNDIRSSIKQIVQAAGMDIPDYQKVAITEMIQQLNTYLGAPVPGGTK